MKQIIILLILLTGVCEVRASDAEEKPVKFKKFISKFKLIQRPFTANTSCYSPDASLSVPLEMSNDSMFLDYSGPAVTIGMLPDTSRFYAVIYCTAAACYMPVLAVFSKKGEIISRKEISKGCGSDVGYTCSEKLEVKSVSKIAVTRTEETFKYDGSNKEIPGSRKKNIHIYTYSLNKNGQIKVKEKTS